MTRPDLSPIVREAWLDGQRRQHTQQLAAVRAAYRPMWPDLLQGLRLVARHALRLTSWAIVLVAGLACTLAYLFPVQLP